MNANPTCQKIGDTNSNDHMMRWENQKASVLFWPSIQVTPCLHWESKGKTKEEWSVENKVTKHKKQIDHRELLKEEDGKRKIWSRIMKSKSRRRGDSNFVLQCYCDFSFILLLLFVGFSWLAQIYTDLLRIFCFGPKCIYWPISDIFTVWPKWSGIKTDTKRPHFCTDVASGTEYTGWYGT